jgi:hypothetical protein
MKISIARKVDRRKTRSQWDSPPMPLHAVSLLMEAIYLKSRALHDLGKFKGNPIPVTQHVRISPVDIPIILCEITARVT